MHANDENRRRAIPRLCVHRAFVGEGMRDALERLRQRDRVVGVLCGEQCIGRPQFGPGEGRFTQVVQFLEECETEVGAILRMQAGQ